jgi:hypothetical protein
MILVTECFAVAVLFACVNGFVLDSKTYTGNGECKYAFDKSKFW